MFLAGEGSAGVRIDPYKTVPVSPRVAWLSPEGVPVDEDGTRLSFDAWPDGTRLWASWDTVYRLIREGVGEALCWNGEEIRWRLRPPRGGDSEYGWRPQKSDAHVVRYPFDEDQGELILRGMVAWRDWLEYFGAAATGSTGSSAWSLLRARLELPLWTRVGRLPALKFTSGGRIENGPRGSGTYTGRLVHHDLPAAYASELGGLRYGGRWQEVTGFRDPGWWAQNGLPVFVRARVRLPEGLPFGLLLKRPRRRGYLAGLLESGYPRDGVIQGVWTWQEVSLAVAYGADVRVLNVWAHRARPSQLPFAPWWSSIEEGRGLGGLAGRLAKMTGNALWGRLAMDANGRGDRVVRSRKNGRGKLVQRKLPSRPAPPADHALAETVAGRVRARLTRAMLETGDNLVCVHTDGLWRVDDDYSSTPEGWRRDRSARRLELVQPMILRWWPRPRGDARVVFAGVPACVAAGKFDQVWERAQTS